MFCHLGASGFKITLLWCFSSANLKSSVFENQGFRLHLSLQEAYSHSLTISRFLTFIWIKAVIPSIGVHWCKGLERARCHRELLCNTLIFSFHSSIKIVEPDLISPILQVRNQGQRDHVTWVRIIYKDKAEVRNAGPGSPVLFLSKCSEVLFLSVITILFAPQSSFYSAYPQFFPGQGIRVLATLHSFANMYLAYGLCSYRTHGGGCCANMRQHPWLSFVGLRNVLKFLALPREHAGSTCWA